MYLTEEISCCGIKEISDVQAIHNYKDELIELIKDEDNGGDEEWFEEGRYKGPAYAFFSTIQSSDKGDLLMKFIKDHKLGEVKKMRPRVNPNTSNTLTMYCWGINKKNLYTFYVKYGVGVVENNLPDEDEEAN